MTIAFARDTAPAREARPARSSRAQLLRAAAELAAVCAFSVLGLAVALLAVMGDTSTAVEIGRILGAAG